MRIVTLTLVVGAVGMGCGGEEKFPSSAELEQLDAIRFVTSAVSTDKTNALFALQDRTVVEDFGEALFHDKALSACNEVACADCHQAPSYADPGNAFSKGCGGQEGLRNAPSLLNARYGRFYFWDGRADSLWAQATGPLTDPREMGASKEHIQSVLQAKYADAYQGFFGKLPQDATADEVLSNVGKAIQVYLWEDRFVAAQSPFDTQLREFVEKAQATIDAETVGSGDAGRLQEELEAMPLFLGLKTFVRKGQCIVCHKGDMLTDDTFHNIGIKQVPLPEDRWDHGLAAGYQQLLGNVFNGRGSFSADKAAGDTRISSLRELAEGQDGEGAFKTPTLRNVALSAPYMHDGSLGSLEDVVEFYNRGGDPVGMYPGRRTVSIVPLGLEDKEKKALVDLLHLLTDEKLAE